MSFIVFHCFLKRIDSRLVDDIAEDICWYYLNQSAYVCERCGEPGEIREDRAWIQSLCDKCVKEEEKEEKEEK